MANQAHLNLVKQGKDHFSQWRRAHPNIQLDLSGADLDKRNLSQFDLSEADFSGSDLFNTNLRGANLRGAHFYRARLEGTVLTNADLTDADLTDADLRSSRLRGAVLVNVNFKGVNLSGADLSKTDLSDANLCETNLSDANLSQADLHGADLSQANLMGATLVDTDLSGAILTNCRIHGIAAWNVQLQGATQLNLIITRDDEPTITVDNLKVAQFIYLLLNNQEIRDVINTITYKVVLILGRFIPERKAILDALRDELRKQNYLPVLFDFDRPTSRDLTETVSTLAHLARFIIVDLTDPSSAPHEVATIIPQCIVPVQPLLLEDEVQPRHEYAMFHDLRTRYHWVLPTFRYQDTANLLASLQEHIIVPAEQKAQELAER